MVDSFYNPSRAHAENKRKEKEAAKRHEEYQKRSAAEVVARYGDNHNYPEHIIKKHATPEKVEEYKRKNNWPKEHQLPHWKND